MISQQPEIPDAGGSGDTYSALPQLDPNGSERRAARNEIHPASPRPDWSRVRNADLPVMIVVEDDADDFMLLRLALATAGVAARVWWAQDAQQAMGILDDLQHSHSSICLVIDLGLPVMNGLALMQQIKARKVPIDVKCAVLTGTSDNRSGDLARAHGADAFFRKPCDPAGLVEIARALQKLAPEKRRVDPA